MIIDKTYRRKVLSYANGSTYIVTVPKEVKEGMGLDTGFIAQMEFNDEKREITVSFMESASDDEEAVERKVMSINEQLVFTIPAKKAKEYGIDDNTIVELDGDIDKKQLTIQVNGKDMSGINEVEENE